MKNTRKRKAERVIFRVEWCAEMGQRVYYACFPDDMTWMGRVPCLPFTLTTWGHEAYTTFQNHEEISWGWILRNTKLIRKGSDEARRCLKEITVYYGNCSFCDSDFRIVERATRAKKLPC